jgi:hypothetical protein
MMPTDDTRRLPSHFPYGIEVRRWDGTAVDADRVINWVLKRGGTANYRCRQLTSENLCPETEEEHHIMVTVHRDVQYVEPGEYVMLTPTFDVVTQETLKELYGETPLEDLDTGTPDMKRVRRRTR